ncbi:DUF1800 domain-containing protein [Solwaraspora sp. WMMB335]|uniref:DUF1800 domain-containing protein n=1 Tax=Solwaraspora sp. WMMB335 TaxID=3404118 RepID=UPI003B946274
MTDDVALLLRRSGFGPTAAELTAARRTGFAQAVSALVAPAGPDLGASASPVPDLGPDPYDGLDDADQAAWEAASRAREQQTLRLTRWWLDRMSVADHQVREKLVFFWHGHWATSIRKVIRPSLMLRQHQTLRASADVRTLAHRMVRDPALIFWLDGQLNDHRSANENFGRELMELFLLGIGAYTERDVKEAGRALTGWRIDYASGTSVLVRRSHDDGVKTILGRSAAFGADDLVDLLLDRPECPRFIAARLWHRYASSQRPVPADVRESMAAAFPDPVAMLRVLFTSAAFADSAGELVKQPVEWLVGAVRQLGIRPGGWDDRTTGQVLYSMDRLGQVPFAPPSVGGWPAGANWLTPGTAQARLGLANRILVGMPSLPSLNPESLANLLTIDTWTNRTYAGLREVTDQLQLLLLGLASPEYLVT